MQAGKVCVLGGSGFIGSALVRKLSASDVPVMVPTRRSARLHHLEGLSQVTFVTANIRNPDQLQSVMAGCTAVVNLVGILHPGQDGEGFAGAHVKFPKAVATACAAAGIKRIIHMSALNADSKGPSEYLRSRGHGESVVWEVAQSNSLQVTMLRPSVVFGPGDKFINMFAQLIRSLPIIPLGSGEARFQPVCVDDVVHAIACCLEKPETIGQTYPLCGPEVFTLRELVDLVIRVLGKRRLVIALGPRLSTLQAMALELLMFFTPNKLITRDNVRSMSLPNVCNCPFPPVFGFQPVTLEPSIRGYLCDAKASDR